MPAIILCIKVLNLSRLLFILPYAKFEWIVRGLIYLDATCSVLEAFVPLEQVLTRNIDMSIIVLEILSNYCGDFFANLAVINV